MPSPMQFYVPGELGKEPALIQRLKKLKED